MALQTASGVVTISTGAIGTTFTVSGLPFQPQAIVFVWNMRASAGIAEADHSAGIGFATSTSSRRAYAIQIDHALAANSNRDNVWRNDCCITTLTTAAAVGGHADLDAILSDGFRLIIDDVFPAAMEVGWIAYGGSDISNVAIVDWTERTTTGDTDVATGFALNTGLDDKAVIAVGIQNTSAAGTAASDSNLAIAIAAGDTIVNAVAAMTGQDSADPSRTASYARTGDFIVNVNDEAGTDTVDCRSTVSAWLADGFRVNTSETNGSAYRRSALVIKGGRWQVGDFVTSTGTSNQQEATSYVPNSLFAISICWTASVADTPAPHAEISVGAATSPTARWAFYWRDADAAGSSDAAHAHTISQFYYNGAATAATEDGTADLISFDSTPGFTWVMDNADPSANNWVGYLISASGPQTVDSSGSTSITKPTASGTAEREVTSTGSPSITKPTSSGSSTVTQPVLYLYEPPYGGVFREAFRFRGRTYYRDRRTEVFFAPPPATIASGSPSITKPTATGVAEREVTSSGSPSITKPTTSAAVKLTRFASGSPSITKPTSTGAAERIVKASGTPSITKPTATGVAEREVTATGSPSITKPTTTGAIKLTRFASGSPSITKPTSTGVSERIVKASGTPSITKPTSAGVAERIVTATGSPSITKPTSSGAATVSGDAISASGSPSITKPTATGAIKLTRFASGSPSITKPTTTGAIKLTRFSSGSPSITKPTSTGTAERIVLASGSPVITKPTSSGVAEREVTATGSPSITKPTTAGSIKLTRFASGSPSITKPTAAGAAERIVKASGTPSITKPTTTGAIQLTRFATGSPSITKPTSTGAIKLTRHASGTPSITKPTATGVASVEGVVNANGSPSITKPTATGTVDLTRFASGSPSITKPTSTGVAERAVKASGTPSITKPTSAGVAERAVKASGSPSITKPTTAGSIVLTRHASGAPVISKPTSEGEAGAGLRGSGTPSITKPTASGYALLNPVTTDFDRVIIVAAQNREVDALTESRLVGVLSEQREVDPAVESRTVIAGDE